MATLNRCTLIGRVTADPDQPRTTTGGSTVVKLRLAVGRSRKDPATGTWVADPNVLYIDCEAFARPDDRRNLVDVISQYVKKGSELYVEGRLQLDEWEDKNGGGKRSKHKIVLSEVQLLGDKNPAPAEQAPARQPVRSAPVGGDGDDDQIIPF